MPNVTATSQRVEILGLGVSTIDDLLVLESMPRPNHKQQVLSKTRQCGGLTGSALVAAARLGCRTGFLIALGQGELSAFTRKHFTDEGVVLFEAGGGPDTEPYQSTILTEAGTGERSILWDNSQCSPPAAGEREIGLATSAGCLFVDHVYARAILPLVRAARDAGVPIVGDFERVSPGSDELMALTDHLILPLSFAHERFG
ncbi:MAG: hypothetical protein LUG50_13155, partial [Planctomycetaceae bacterium]|nr:hypothetical protein [Planctomycetaceae bacterium]